MSNSIIPDLIGAARDAHSDKRRFHRMGSTFLRQIARHLGLPKTSYEIRSNKGGPAVPGEITLHGENIYIQVHERSILFRRCYGRHDYTGNTNNNLSFHRLESMPIPEAARLLYAPAAQRSTRMRAA